MLLIFLWGFKLVPCVLSFLSEEIFLVFILGWICQWKILSVFVFLGVCSFTLHFWVMVWLDMEFLVDYLFLLALWIGHSVAIWSLWDLLRSELLILLWIQSVLGISSCSCFQGFLFVFHFGHFINLISCETMSFSI